MSVARNAGLLFVLLLGASCHTATPTGPYNVLFIAVDDLRPDLASFGETYMATPSLDKLASEGRPFSHHYVQVPTCGASRYALWTGLRPSTPAQLDNEAFVRLMPRDERERPESFADLFRRNGYHTASIGKLSHYPDGRIFSYAGEGDGRLEMPFSWDEVDGPIGKWGTAWNAFFGYSDGSNRNQARGAMPAYESADVPDTSYADGIIAEKAIIKLRELRSERFLLAVGFFKPHLPFTAPKKYWDLYDAGEIELSPNPDAPEGVNPNALHDSRELFGSYGPFESVGAAGKRIDDAEARTLRHAYRAAVSFSDAQVGKVLDELDRLGLSDHTIVVLWGDHGWHLGDQTIWGKHTTFERALRSPLIIRVPGMSDPGVFANGLVETVDLYPTLAELCGLTPPDNLAGTSIVPLLNDPAHPGKDGAFGYWTGRRTLRTERFRITEYESGEPRVELFDHRTDSLETTNVADTHADVVTDLLKRLSANAPSLQSQTN